MESSGFFSDFTKDDKIVALKALSVVIGSLGVFGIGAGMANALIGISNSVEVRVDMVGCLCSISTIGSFIFFIFVVLLSASAKPTDLASATISKYLMTCAAGAVMSICAYTGACCIGLTAKYGVPAKVRQKKFSTLFFVNIAVSELVGIMGFILFFMIKDR